MHMHLNNFKDDLLSTLIFKKSNLTGKMLFIVSQLLMDPLVLSVLYVWCQVNKDTIVQFWFGMQFKVRVLHLHHQAWRDIY